MRIHGVIALALLGAFAGLSTSSALAQDSAAEVPAEFTEAFLGDRANVVAGKEIWVEQCSLCHGNKSYPGKAPKLKPRRYTPDFVFNRVTRGFRKMPAWNEIYTHVSPG